MTGLAAATRGLPLFLPVTVAGPTAGSFMEFVAIGSPLPDDGFIAVSLPPGEGEYGICRFDLGPKAHPNASAVRPRRSRNHSAVEHFVGDRCGDLIDEGRAHLRITPQNSDGALFLCARGCVLILSYPQLLAGGTLIFADDPAGNAVHDR